jgi:hypothetical protein
MRLFSAPAALFVVAATAVSAAAAEPQWLQYRVSREPWRNGIASAAVPMPIAAAVPEGVTPPKLAASDARFVRWLCPIAPDGGVWMAVDRSRGTGFYDVLFIDSDCDGDLSDEEPMATYAASSAGSRFGPAKIVFETADGPVTCHLNVVSYSMSGYSSVAAANAGWYEGKVKIGGKAYDCRIVDQNSNGVYNDRSIDFDQMDLLYLGEDRRFDMKFAGRYVLVDGGYYRSEGAADGAFVMFEPADDIPMGRMEIPEGVTDVSIAGENGLLSFKPEGGASQVPAGKWRIREWKAERKDKNGSNWTLRGYDFPAGHDFEVTEGAATAVALGEPAVAKLAVRKSGSSYALGEALKGSSGEKIELRRNKSLPPAPRVRITNKDESYNRVYNFKYG